MQADNENSWERFPKQAVYGMIFNDLHHVLMVKRRDLPVWVLPGGGLDRHETPEEGALREVFEESGYQVAIIRKVAEYFPVNALTQYTHLFECQIIGGSPQIGSETQEICFFPLDAMDQLPPPFEYWIKDAKANHPYVIRKNIEGVTWMKLVRLLISHPYLVCRYLLTKIGIRINSN